MLISTRTLPDRQAVRIAADLGITLSDIAAVIELLNTADAKLITDLVADKITLAAALDIAARRRK